MNTNSLKFNGSDAAPDCARESGFTRTDLVVFITMAGLLGLVLLPALASDRSMSDSYRCMNNLRQLATGWLMYSGDNNDKIVRTAGLSLLVINPNDASAKPGGARAQWVLGTADSLDPDLIRNGLLFPYVNNLDAYKCPADIATMNGIPTLRSVSMNAWMNPITPEGTLDEANYVIFRQQTDIRNPAGTWLLMDENPYTINDGWFVIRPNVPIAWYDVPAAYHRGAAGIVFTDTHVEMKRWTDRIVLAQTWGGISRPDPESNDLAWLLARTTYPR